MPGYAKLRSEAKKKVGAEKEHGPPRFEACLVRVHELWEPGYLVEHNPDGTETVFVPQAPAGCMGRSTWCIRLSSRSLGSTQSS